MKRNFSICLILISVYFISFCAVLNLNAQNYLISFAGTGASANVSTVEVENLTSGATLTLNGNDILHLASTVGISWPENLSSSAMKIYPNPMLDNSIIELYPPAKGDAIITIYEMTGKPIIQVFRHLENCRQEFRLSGLTNGLYLLNVSGKGYQFSGKILSNGQKPGNVMITKVSDAYDPTENKISKKGSNEVKSAVDMQYRSGDKLKYTAISGNYSLVRTDIPTRDKTLTFNFLPCADGDSFIYKTVKIGAQIWFAENLKTTKYNDGTPIPFVHGYEEWAALSTAGYCWYNNAEYASEYNYGALYNKYAVLTGKLCPEGWHIPKESEWLELINYLGGVDVTGGKIKETGVSQWYDPNIGATNESGFSAVPSGNRRFDGSWDYGGNGAFWWSISDEDPSSAWAWAVECNTACIYKYIYDDKASFTVRCVIGDAEPALSLSTISESKVTDSTATIEGIIMDDGGSAVTERGICWSTLPNPTISDSKTIEGSGPGTFKCLINGLELFTKYFVRAYAINDLGIAYGNQIDFISGIGMNYMGGKLAYISNPGGDPIHGLIAAPEDHSGEDHSGAITWSNGSDTSKVGTYKEIGSGNLNTNSIVASQGEGNYAAKFCYDLVLGGYSDWYLPSSMELNILYLNKEAIGGFERAYYWSSSEDNGETVWIQYFGNGGQYPQYKNCIGRVRAVRSF